MPFAMIQTEAEKLAEEEKNKKFLDSAIESATQEVMKRASTDDQTLSKLENEAEAKALWESNGKLRAEFGKFETFRSYWKAVKAGRVAVYGFGRQQKKKSA